MASILLSIHFDAAPWCVELGCGWMISAVILDAVFVESECKFLIVSYYDVLLIEDHACLARLFGIFNVRLWVLVYQTEIHFLGKYFHDMKIGLPKVGWKSRF